MAKITILGGGIAGCTTAVELAKKGHEVIILERDEDILRGTSARTPGRMGLGYHYFDSETAKLYMTNTVEFMKNYSDCFLGDETTPYLRGGRYFITKDSLVSAQDLMAAYDEISAEFEKHCDNDPSNNIFKTRHLHRAMRSSEFQEDVNMDKVAFAIETKELLLDWRKYEARLKGEIEQLDISIKTGFEISQVKRTGEGKFKIISTLGDLENADQVINCTWQNIDKINEMTGIGDAKIKKDDPNQSVTSRLKLLAEVELAEALREKHSMFFCVGPHAMFSNLGNGIGRITYAPVTNFGVTTDSQMPEIFERWLNQGLNPEEEKEYGEKIIQGVAEYIPAMKDARLKRVIPGIVKSKGAVDLNDRQSPFHKRNYDGVEEQELRWIDNASMKLFYALENAKKVSEIVANQEASWQVIKQHHFFENISPITANFFDNYLAKNFKSEEILRDPEKLIRDISQTHQLKKILNDEIPNPTMHLQGRGSLVNPNIARSGKK